MVLQMERTRAWLESVTAGLGSASGGDGIELGLDVVWARLRWQMGSWRRRLHGDGDDVCGDAALSRGSALD
ncbi:hypothetical protein M0R45_030790 [Rubus argutus]|uniref:Uncharacterized protein n=1 Tax=Rubus argutus TaxID=59490 RepID=A0AAW1WCE0_RUBAR